MNGSHRYYTYISSIALAISTAFIVRVSTAGSTRCIPEERGASEEQVQRYEAAARAGDLDALSYYLDALVFRANSVTKADPERAYAFLSELLEERRRTPQGNESEHFWSRYEEALQHLRMAAEAGPFDGHAFLAHHGLDSPDALLGMYGVWQWAEQAARGEFGDPDPDLIFQLVIRGGEVPGEWEFAVAELYPKWKAGQPFAFDLCHYVMSGMGLGFCNHRRALEQDRELRELLERIALTLPPSDSRLPVEVYEAAMTFFRLKAQHEEGHTGADIWRARHREGSVMRHKDRFMEWLEARTDLRLPADPPDIDQVEADVLAVLDELPGAIAADTYWPEYYEITWEGIQETHEAWHRMRRLTLRLLHTMGGQEFAEQWQAELYAERLKHLQSTLSVATGQGYIK